MQQSLQRRAEQPTLNLWAQAYQRFDHVVAPSRHTANRLADAGVHVVKSPAEIGAAVKTALRV